MTQTLQGIAPISHLGVIRVQGDDAASFLHGQLTNDFALLDLQHARLAAFCSAKGRMQASFIGFKRAHDDILLIISRDLLPQTLKRLSMFVLRAKAKLSDATADFHLLGLMGSAISGGTQAPWSLHAEGDAYIVHLYPAAGQARALWIAPSSTPAASATLAPDQWLSVAGYSINTLTMFAMVLAIGLLVDDAIVVVENVERVMHETGLSAKEATRQSMREITSALVGIGVTLSAVFVPMAFFGGSTGVIYRQFSITIVAAMAFSVFVALTLTPALCATILKAPSNHGQEKHIRRGLLGLNDRFFRWFNHHFDATALRYQSTVAWTLGRAKRMMLIFLAILAAVWLLMSKLPTSFLPDEDQGFVYVNVNLPAGASDARLQAVLDEIREYFLRQSDVVSFNQVSGLSGDQSSARGFVRLKTWAERPLPSQSAGAFAHRATQELASIRDARIFVMQPPAVRGLGSNAGFNFMLKDLNGMGHDALLAAKDQFLAQARKHPELTGLRATNLDDATELRLDIDDRKAAALNLSYSDINSVLSSAMGGTYVNDFLNNGRVKRVYIQGDAPHRMLPQDIAKWSVRNKNGEMVPFSAFSTSHWAYGSPQLMRYNGSPAYEIVGNAAPGVSSGVAMQLVEDILKTMPNGIGYEWTGASLQERQSGAQAPLLYAISILFVFLCLAALYESWTVPLSVMLAVPLGVVGALLATYTRGLTNDVYFQVGLLTTVGLASKNAILIVEFAVQLQEQGKSLFNATVEAVRMRLRPILMTSLAFGFGVIPLALGTGAGAGGRNAIGTAVLGGTVASTVLGLFMVPVFFLLVRSWFKSRRRTDDTLEASTTTQETRT